MPAEVLDALGAGKRPPVSVTVNGYTYRSTVASMGGKYLLPFSAQRRSESGTSGGDAIDVELELDGSPDAEAAWAKLSYSQQKAHVTSVSGAKAAETRERRVAAVVTKLLG